jgi:hypothetical protein
MKAPKKKDVVRCTWASNDLSILYHDLILAMWLAQTLPQTRRAG